MPRINVWIPDELHTTVKDRLPGLNVSKVVQTALAAQLECWHPDLMCASCSLAIDKYELIDERMSAFYGAAIDRLAGLAYSGGTAEGSARVLKDVAERHQISAALNTPLPRLSRTRREELKPIPLPTEAASRGRHPTARSKTA